MFTFLYSKALYKKFYKNIKTINDEIWKILRIHNMLKLLKMLKQIISQLEQMCLKLGLENGYTLTVSNFKRQFIPQKWNKGAITKGLRISSWDLRRPWSQERRWWPDMELGCKRPSCWEKQVYRLYYDNNNCLHFYILKRFTKNSIQILKRLTIVGLDC